MNLVKAFFLSAAVVIVLSGASFSEAAEKGHAHKSPHGGVVQEAAGVHAEFLVDKAGQPKLYLYDKSMKPLDRSDAEAKLTVKGHGAAEETRVLTFSKDSKEGPVFRGEPIKAMKDWETAVVSLKLKDKWTDIRFSRNTDRHGH
jgi:hypothetical protein